MGADLKPGSLLARLERGEPFFREAASRLSSEGFTDLKHVSRKWEPVSG